MSASKAFQIIGADGVDRDKLRVYDHGVVQTVMASKPDWACGHVLPGAIAVAAPSVRSLLHHVLEQMPTPQKSKSSSEHGSGSFYHFDTYDECLDAYMNHPNKIAQFRPSGDSLQSPNNIGQDIEYAVTGDILDIGRFLTDDPEQWGSMFMGNEIGLYATILVNISVVWSTEAEVIAEHGRRVVRLVDWLENQRIRTEVRGIDINECSAVEIVAKRFEDPLDLNAIAVMSHPDFLRRVGFRIAEYSDTHRSSYGTAVSFARGSLKIPPIPDARQLLIYTEVPDSMREVEANFDYAEKELHDIVESGFSPVEQRTIIAQPER